MVFSDGKSAERLRINRSSSTLRARVQETLRSAIFDGYLVPGQHLIEREMCERIRVSRPILREALSNLEARGLVERLNNRGYVVCTLSVKKTRQLYEVRSVLEELAVGLFAEHASDAQLELLKDALQNLDIAFRSENTVSIRNATTQYYACLLTGCGNGEVAHILGTLHDRIALLRSRSMSRSKRWKISLQELTVMTDAILNRDVEKSRLASREHIRMAAQSAEETVNDGDEYPDYST